MILRGFKNYGSCLDQVYQFNIKLSQLYVALIQSCFSCFCESTIVVLPISTYNSTFWGKSGGYFSSRLEKTSVSLSVSATVAMCLNFICVNILMNKLMLHHGSLVTALLLHRPSSSTTECVNVTNYLDAPTPCVSKVIGQNQQLPVLACLEFNVGFGQLISEAQVSCH